MDTRDHLMVLIAGIVQKSCRGLTGRLLSYALTTCFDVQLDSWRTLRRHSFRLRVLLDLAFQVRNFLT